MANQPSHIYLCIVHMRKKNSLLYQSRHAFCNLQTPLIAFRKPLGISSHCLSPPEDEVLYREQFQVRPVYQQPPSLIPHLGKTYSVNRADYE